MDAHPVLSAVPLEDANLSAEELARACSVHLHWVTERVQSGLLGTLVTATTVATATATVSRVTEWRFCSPDLTRARRLRSIERDFEANPELAALTVDLIEEVERLRQRLSMARAG